MSDELDSLSDAALSEVFAVEVAGWRHTVASAESGTRWWFDENDNHVSAYSDPDSGCSFAISADAVLPYLPSANSVCVVYLPAPRQWMVAVTVRSINHRNFTGKGTFPRAACIALIRAKRAEKGAA